MKSTSHVAVIDIGTSSIRASAVDSFARVTYQHQASFLNSSPAPGFEEFDALELYEKTVHCLNLLMQNSSCDALAITNQRASTVVFDPNTGKPISKGISWQDLRTAPLCLALQDKGVRLAPNQSATKIALVLDLYDPNRSQGLLAGTIDAWLCYKLTGNLSTDHTNVATTGLVHSDARSYDEKVLEILRIDRNSLPEIHSSMGFFGNAKINDLQIPLVAIMGDQQASMLGQAVTKPGRAKVTFGTGAMIDIITGEVPPKTTSRNSRGTYPIVARSHKGSILFGLEGIGLHAGSAVEFGCRNLKLAESPSQIEIMAAKSKSQFFQQEIFVPALTGLATPYWDFGALGIFANLSQSTTHAELANSILLGVAHQGADLIDAVENDSNQKLRTLRIDGGMSKNNLFLEYLATFSGKKLELLDHSESTTIGAAIAAHLAIGNIVDIDEIDNLLRPSKLVTPKFDLHSQQVVAAKALWTNAVEISLNSVPELSSVRF